MGRTRVDVLLTERGLAESRAKAQALVVAGRVHSGNRRVDKPGTLLDDGAPLAVTPGNRFVSRGGLKLDAALTALGVEVEGATCVDVGASTGGFTDCLLQRGAARVHAIDVGHGQLDDRLRRDDRVVVRERTNARYLTSQDVIPPADLVVVDASFIGIRKLLPALDRVLRREGRLLVLVKPQFEAAKEIARRGRGVLRDRERLAAIEGAVADIEAAGYRILGRCDSTVPGPKGNVEHFVLAARRAR